MGGGGGINPLSIVSTLVFGPEVGALVGLATADSGSSRTAPEDTGAQEAEEAAAEARRRADRTKAEATLLARARQAERAGQSAEQGPAQSLGAPDVAAAGLKARLGQ